MFEVFGWHLRGEMDTVRLKGQREPALKMLIVYLHLAHADWEGSVLCCVCVCVFI